MRPVEISRFLPEVFCSVCDERSIMAVLIAIMSRLHEPSEKVLDEIDAFCDPRRTNDRFVPMLARWVDLSQLFVRSSEGSHATSDAISTGNGHLRELIARSAYLSQWRGTRKGLIAFLETATGSTGFAIDERPRAEDGRVRPFHLRVSVAPRLEEHLVLIERIIELEKPAHVTYDIVMQPRGT